MRGPIMRITHGMKISLSLVVAAVGLSTAAAAAVPLAIVTSPTIVAPFGSTIYLDGSMSYSLDGNQLNFFWDLNNSTNAVDVLPANFFTQISALDYHTANLTVTNSVTGEYSTASVLITLSAPSASAVPEPSTWAMMLMGFAGIGFAMRRRRVAVPQIA